MKTSNYLTLAGAALCLAGLSAPAHAASSLPQLVDGKVSVDANSSDPGLVVTIGGVREFSNVLNAVGDSFVVNDLFTISTPETTVNGDDRASYPITASFTFTNPLGADGTIGGVTYGDVYGSFFNLFGPCGEIAGGCGELVWDGPKIFSFGHIGRLGVELSNVTFGTDGGERGVNGTFTLLAAVPEPSTWAMLILGFGAVGFMMRSRRRENVSVSYA